MSQLLTLPIILAGVLLIINAMRRPATPLLA